MRLCVHYIERDMLISKMHVLLVAIGIVFFVNSVQGDGHKRVIIRVPQRIRHIYHHHVKKVPVYVLLPDKRSRVLDDLEDATKGLPCKELIHRQEDKALKYRYPKYYEAEQDVYVPSSWKEDTENKGAYLRNGEYNTLDYNDPIPPPIENKGSPSNKIRNHKRFQGALNHHQNDRNYNGPSFDMTLSETFKDHAAQPEFQSDDKINEQDSIFKEDAIHITYPPSILFSNPENRRNHNHRSFAD